MELMEAINARRSIRKFKPDVISDSIINEMLEAARRAPTAGNSQIHVFGVIKDTETRKKIGESLGGRDWIAEAPVIIVCCARIDGYDSPVPPYLNQVEKDRYTGGFIEHMAGCPDQAAAMRMFQNAVPFIPVGYMSLVAAAHGLGSCMIGRINVTEINKILNLPENITSLYLLPVGYPDAPPRDKVLKPLEEITFYDVWE